MKTLKIILFCFIIIVLFTGAYGRAILIHNSLQEIENCTGKLQLKLIRIWGGDEEEDEHKFFRTPRDIVIDQNENVYICDEHIHKISVFDSKGVYKHTIGRRGRGPGDLFSPSSIALNEAGNLVVLENMGRRIQVFSPAGKSLDIFKLKFFAYAIETQPTKKVVVYSTFRTFESRKLLCIYDYNGRLGKEIGVYHDTLKSPVLSEGIAFTVDGANNFWVANRETPVIRKYSYDNQLLLAITYEMPLVFKNVPEVTLDETGNEIKIKREKRWAKEKRSGRSIQVTGSKKIILAHAVGVNARGRIFLVTYARKMTEKETQNSYVLGSQLEIVRKGQDISLFENIDLLRLLVFNSSGKIIAFQKLSTLCDKIYIKDNRLFVVEGYKTQRIMEYEMIFKE